MINFDFVEEGLPDNWSVFECWFGTLSMWSVSNGAKGQLGLIFDEKFLEEVDNAKRIQSKWMKYFSRNLYIASTFVLCSSSFLQNWLFFHKKLISYLLLLFCVGTCCMWLGKLDIEWIAIKKYTGQSSLHDAHQREDINWNYFFAIEQHKIFW